MSSGIKLIIMDYGYGVTAILATFEKKSLTDLNCKTTNGKIIFSLGVFRRSEKVENNVNHFAWFDWKIFSIYKNKA